MRLGPLLILLLGCALLTAACKPKGPLKLELLQVLFRHGERTPQRDELKLIPEGSSEFVEPWGFAQLTNTGKQQEYKIGKLLRKLYGDFLGDEYRPGQVFATSSNFDRTKMSLQLVLAGLYPPTDELLWSEELKWMPLPIHFVPKELDNLFNLSACPKFYELYRKLMDSDEVKKRLEEFADLIKYLRRFFPETVFDPEQLFYLNNVLTIQESLNITPAAWHTPEVRERIRAGGKFYLDTLSLTPDLSRLNGGGLARRLLENLDLAGAQRDSPRRIYLYSGHEFTVYALARAHNITLERSPAYGSALIFEKLRDQADQLFVKISYWTGTTEELRPVKLNGCGRLCSVKKYLQVIQPSLPTDEEMRCLYENLKPEDLERILFMDRPGIPG